MTIVSSDVAAMLKASNKAGVRDEIDAADALRGFVDARKFGVVPGASDLHLRLQEALEEAGTVQLTESITLTGSVNVPSDSYLLHSRGTITFQLASTVTPVFVLDDVNNVTLRFKSFTNVSGYPIFAEDSSNIYVYRTEINHGADENLSGGGANSGTWFRNCENVTIEKAKVSRVRGAKGIQFREGNQNIRVIDCSVDLTSRAGIAIDRQNENVWIVRNRITRTNRGNVTGTADGGIDVYGADDDSNEDNGLLSSNVNIIGNYVSIGGVYGSMDRGPSLIRVVSVKNSRIIGNTCIADGITSSILTLNSRQNASIIDSTITHNYFEDHVSGATQGIVAITLSDDEFPHRNIKLNHNTFVANAPLAVMPNMIRNTTPIHGFECDNNEFRSVGEAKPCVNSGSTGDKKNYRFRGNAITNGALTFDIRYVDGVEVYDNDGGDSTRLCNLISNANVRMHRNIPGSNADIYTSNTGLVGSYEMPLVSADKGNSSASIPVDNTTEGTAIWNTPITSNRTCTLLTTNKLPGTRQRIVRTAAATGDFVLNIGATPLTTLDAGQWAEVQFDGTAWVLIGKGSL